ncbi:hypothetical protein DPMN_031963 [Dreissena polymorpha]|uniref:Uncharacterized protein n=1 Tax=Dreissena polymorpha TaxID=45954 RepID=A0A9D4M3S3_DREPO|nr:hypothetical protein DPMN_031963 [Dreissena polymorpha]
MLGIITQSYRPQPTEPSDVAGSEVDVRAWALVLQEELRAIIALLAYPGNFASHLVQLRAVHGRGVIPHGYHGNHEYESRSMKTGFNACT